MSTREESGVSMVAEDPDAPPIGEVFFYVAAFRNATTSPSFGSVFTGKPRLTDSNVCSTPGDTFGDPHSRDRVSHPNPARHSLASRDFMRLLHSGAQPGQLGPVRGERPQGLRLRIADIRSAISWPCFGLRELRNGLSPPSKESGAPPVPRMCS